MNELMDVDKLPKEQLNFWVAEAVGLRPLLGQDPTNPAAWCVIEDDGTHFATHPRNQFSSEWAAGGPLLNDHVFEIGEGFPDRQGCQFAARARIQVDRALHEGPTMYGSTMLEAGMRAIVAARFGKKVPDGSAAQPPERY